MGDISPRVEIRGYTDCKFVSEELSVGRDLVRYFLEV